MRSLSTKLTLAFLLVGVLGAILVSLLIRYRIETAFTQLVSNREETSAATYLVQYYQLTGSWDNVDDFIDRLDRNTYGDDDFRRGWDRFMLAGADQVILYSLASDDIGTSLSRRDLNQATQILINGDTVGWLVAVPTKRSFPMGSAEGQFLRAVNFAALISAVIAAGLALVLGGLLAFTMTRSLREMTEATMEIASGKLGKQVKVRSSDELGELAVSFNKMSSDLARSTHARRQMTADIAHDLRSPLSVISGYAEALSDGKLPGTSEIFTVLHHQSQQLNRLVEDLRILSLADAGELSLNLQPVDPGELLARIGSYYRLAAQERQLTLVLDIPPDLPKVQIDSDRITQVIDNLIGNAFRYTPAGGEVHISAQAEGSRVVIRVRDTGSGISPEDLPHIFERFYKGDKARHTEGESGLGLAIARSIIEAHGGQISALSQPGQGSEFVVSLNQVK